MVHFNRFKVESTALVILDCLHNIVT